MILVTGGTGFVGSHLVPIVARTGEKVRCLVRSQGSTGRLKGEAVEFVQGDVTDPASISAAMQGADSVVHLVAIIREHKQATFHGINVQGTRNMLTAAREQGIKRFVHVSVLDASPDPAYRYTYSKWEGEEAVRRSGLDFVILRPSAIFGRAFGYSFIDSIVRSLKSFPLFAVVAGDGETLFQPIWVDDVASCIVTALTQQESGHTYDIGGPEHLTYEQILDAVLAALGERRPKLRIPLPLLRLAVPVMERTMNNPLLTSVELDQLEMDNLTDLDAVERHFGFRPLPLRQGLDYIRPCQV